MNTSNIKTITVILFMLTVLYQQLNAQQKDSRLDSAFAIAMTQVNKMTADTIYNTSFITDKGEKIQRLEFVLDTTIQAVWKAFTNEQEIKTWMVPVVKLDLRIGGKQQSHYRKDAIIGETGTITLNIINYLPIELITYKVNLTEAFPEKCRQEDNNLQYIVRFDILEKNKTKLTFSMFGWGQGNEWDAVYNKFEQGNIWTFKKLIKRFKTGSIDWK